MAPSTSSDSGASRPDFRPTPKQLAYASQLAEALAEGKPATDTALCKLAGVSRYHISRWRNDDAFEAWLDAFLHRMLGRSLAPILLRAKALALKGSVKHMEFFARWSGLVPVDAQPEPAGEGGVTNNNYGVVLLVPRPGAQLAPTTIEGQAS